MKKPCITLLYSQISFLGAQATLGASNSLILQDGEEEEEKLAFFSSKSTFGT